MKKKYENLTIQEAWHYLKKGKKVSINGWAGHWKLKRNKIAFIPYTLSKDYSFIYEVEGSYIPFDAFATRVKNIFKNASNGEARLTTTEWKVVRFPLSRRIRYSTAHLIRMIKIRRMGDYFLQGLCSCPKWINEDDCGDIT